MRNNSDSTDWRTHQKKPPVVTRPTRPHRPRPPADSTRALDLSNQVKTNQLLLNVLNNAIKPPLIKKQTIDPAGMRERVSLGVACCRFNGVRPEMLFVCKRYTYAYNVFVHGRYNSTNNAEIISLLSGMTIDEKHDIMSLNFIQIWYRIWLNNTVRNSSYFLAKNKFESTFVADSGARLHRLISKATHSGKIWEIPKGRKKNKSEQNIHCAIREFHEETRISKGSYRIWVDAMRTYTYVDDGIRYTNQYFLAFTRHNIEPRIDFSAREQIEEVSDIKWMDIEEIRRVDETGRLGTFVKPIFNFMRKHAKK